MSPSMPRLRTSSEKKYRPIKRLLDEMVAFTRDISRAFTLARHLDEATVLVAAINEWL